MTNNLTQAAMDNTSQYLARNYRIETLRTKLGTAKGIPASRIWLEGKRLTLAGFTKGKRFDKVFNRETGSLILQLADTGAKVSGKGNDDHPIIDITGKKIASYFLGLTHVRVTFEHGRITIMR